MSPFDAPYAEPPYAGLHARATPAPPRPLADDLLRTVRYLRLSVTDRCDLRCTLLHGRAHDLPPEALNC